MKRSQINERVTVTSLGFRKNLATYPRQMEFNGVTYNFVDAGLRCLIKNGSRIAEILALSDGKTSYYLKTDSRGMIWTLLKIV